MNPPAFQFYPDDFIAGTMDMDDAEVGLYMRLLCVQWSKGSIPAETAELLRFSRGSTTLQAERVKQKFELGPDGRLRNRRLEDVRAKQQEWRRKSSDGGKKSAEQRKMAKGGSTTVEPRPQPNGNTPISSLQSPISSTPISQHIVASAPVMDASSIAQAKPEASDLPGMPKAGYHPDTRAALHILNEAAGIHYREVDSNLKIISARLREPGVDIAGVRLMIERQCKLWKGTDYGKYLRPETLFRQSKFDGYYAARSEPVVRGGANHRNDGLVGGVDPNKARRVLERRAAEAAAKAAAGAPVAGQVAGHGVHLAGHPIAR